MTNIPDNDKRHAERLLADEDVYHESRAAFRQRLAEGKTPYRSFIEQQVRQLLDHAADPEIVAMEIACVFFERLGYADAVNDTDIADRILEYAAQAAESGAANMA